MTEPNQVVYNLRGDVASPQRAKTEYGINPTVVFERDDGWTIGAPESLVEVAASLWPDKCVSITWEGPVGKWTRQRMVEDPARPWTMPSIVRLIFKVTRVPITHPDEVVAIAKQLVERLEKFPVHMHPGARNTGSFDVREYWHPLVRQLCVLREAIEELESLRK